MAFGTIKADSLINSSGVTVDLTAVTTSDATTSASGYMSAADKTKLDGIEASATADQTGAEIKTAYEAEADTNAFTDAEKTKLSGIATGAEVNVDTDLTYTASTRVLASSTGTDATLPEVVAAGDSGLMTGADKTKLDGIATGAEVNVDYDDNVAFTLGTDSDASFVFDGTDTDIRLTAGDLKIEDGTTLRFTFARTTGDLTATGNVTAYSDISLKENIEVIPGALDKVSEIRGVTYDRKDVQGPRQAGVIAQEVEAVLPEVVMTDEEGVKSVAYGNLVGLLIEAVKELKAEVETLKQERN